MRWNIVKKLSVFSIIIITVPVILLGFLTYQASERILIQRMQNTSLHIMGIAADYFIQKYVGETENTINLLTSSPNFNSAIASREIGGVVLQEWENQRRFNDHIWYVYFGSADGKIDVVPSWQPDSGYDPRVRPWYKAAFTNPGTIVWSNPYIETISQNTVISAVKSIEHNGELVGVFAIDTSLYKLSDIIRDLKLGTGAYAILIDKDANIIAHNEVSELGKNVSEEGWFQTLVQHPKKSIYYSDGERTVFVSAVNIAQTGWTLVGFIPEAAFANESLPIKNKTMQVGFWSVLAAIIISLLAARRFVGRMHKLILDMKRVEAGDFSIQFTDHSSDELAELNTKFHNMVKHIQALLQQRDQTATELQRQKIYFAQLFENSPESIAILDSQARIIDINRDFESFFQYELREVYGRLIDDVIVPSTLYEEGLAISKTVLESVKCQLDTTRKRKDGSLVDVQLIAYPIIIDDQVAGIYAIYRDISERKRAENQLQYMSFRDVLTGVFNRNYFEQELQRLESEQKMDRLGIIVCDVDGLKLINDTLGHEKGDLLLKTAAEILQSSIPHEAVLARIGGDEFGILLPGAGEAELATVYTRIHQKLRVYNSSRSDFTISLSLGYASVSHAASLKDAVKLADNRMYKEKLHRSQSARSALVKTLMHALHARDFITEGHGERMQELVEKLARRAGVHEYAIGDMKLFAQFHDLGKVGIPDGILFKPGPLDETELAEMRRHSEIGYRIAIASPELNHIADWILKHHEWWNGNGYPIGLKGTEIPLESRILAIVDAYDAMTNDRPYRKGMDKDTACIELTRCAGKMFDPNLVHSFIEMITDPDE
ncbi:diguanylate cyclase domain-containing protein [Sporomusa malonica]|uniref:PAS domain S-box-containing protein/diguanylate cyclase (GGDEF) domain-containing protein n=1 Tax=Sporomusa malonica TaxID=112901 RepID=A0A1W2E646_9FIRM|nr:diguanylate cyclase [Sporomusa malonica]SMD05271.1 PAS domain S-box-containing protein/diguanylate cyclase (GGDEF) domain-containing protein [Sporomusa malonica]